MDLSLSGTSMIRYRPSLLRRSGCEGRMLYATIRALGSLPSVALSSLMAIVSYLIMLLP